MAEKCYINRGVTKDCEQVQGPGGIAIIEVLDKKYFDAGSVTRDAEGYITSFSTTDPLKLFWGVEFEDDNSAYVNDPTTDKTAGAFFRDITCQYRIDDSPSNRKFVDLLANTRIVMLYQNNLGKWRIVGIQGKGLYLTQVPESNSGAAAADKNTMLLNIKGQENVSAGAYHVWYDAPVYDATTAYAQGDYVKFEILSEFHYYKSLQNANTGNDPDVSPLAWVEVTQAEARDNITNDAMVLLTNP